MHPKTLEGILMLKENRSLWSAVLMQRGMKKHAASSSAGGEQYINGPVVFLAVGHNSNRKNSGNKNGYIKYFSC